MGISNNRKTAKTRSILGLVLIGVLGISACTKQIPFEALPTEAKEKDVSKALIDTKSEFLYSASQQSSSRSAADAFPFLASDNKRVKIEMTKDSLRVIEIERDQRFASNTLNNKLVLEIPIEHVQYECKKDRFGECTNTEGTDDKTPWEQRNTVKIKLEDVKSGELELLPIISSSTFGENCYENVSSRLVKSDIEKDAINFQIERTFKTRLDCLTDEAVTLSDATVSAVYHYSLVKLSSILSKDYKTVSYPESSDDENSFGFFSTSRTKLDVDNNNTDKSVVQIMNRWNPNRKEIVYHLSDEFAKPENKLIKDLTVQTVKSLNDGLSEAGVNFRIDLRNPSGKVPGDIRNSMIVLVEDPVASSVIGYGPQTEDPVTGEIISARTVMFLGTIKKYIKYTYDEIIREKKADQALAGKDKATTTFTLAPQVSARVETLKKTGKVFGATTMVDQVLAKINAPAKTDPAKTEAKGNTQKDLALDLVSGKANIQKAVAELKNYTGKKNDLYSGKDLKSKIKYLQEVKNCAFAPAMEGVSAGISQKLKDQFPADAKAWTELSEEEKDKAIAIILPEIWVPTLIHEIGHNLGLRHNFAASEDKANFLTQEELAKIGVNHNIPFSSVMDYGNDLRTLPVLGKYDIAALRFGYTRKVMVQSGDQEQLVDVSSTLEELKAKLPEGQVVKDFQYCTDENTGINAGCKRFDLGTSYTEIVQNMINEYEEAYSKRNLRDGRSSFSQMDDLTYLARISGLFKELRIMMEVSERIKYKFNIADDAPEWESIPFLKDLKQATLLGGSFMANVILVPDVHCAVSLTAKPEQIIAVVPMKNISDDAMKCTDLKLQPQFKVVGQTGKAFNSKKDPASKNSYADQIDVRGIWLDKVAAIRMLTARTIDIPTMNGNTDNFLNVPELRKGILEVVQGLISNNVVNKVNFDMIDGSKAALEINYDLGETQVINKPLLVEMVERSGMSEDAKVRFISRLGVNRNGTTPLKKIVAKTLAVNSVDPNRVHTADNVIRDAVTVYKYDAVSSQKISKTARDIVVDNVQYVADTNNIFAREAIELLPAVSMMDQLDSKKLEIVLQFKQKKESLPPPTEQTAEAKAEFALMKDIYNKVSAEKMSDYLEGIIKKEDFYTELLQIMPTAN